MKKYIKLWLIIILLPIPLWLSMFILGLIGVVLYRYYYFPLWFLREPFFIYPNDIGIYYPSLYGNIITIIIYSLIYWGIFFMLKKIKHLITNKIEK